MELSSVDDLEGLPQDYIDNHPPDENGIIRITTDYPDCPPLHLYARSEEKRKELMIEFGRCGYPQTNEVLRQILAKGLKLATILALFRTGR